MRVLCVGLAAHTAKQLLHQGIIAERQNIKKVSDLPEWLADDAYEALVLDAGTSGFYLDAVQEIRRPRIKTPIVGIWPNLPGQGWGELVVAFLDSGGDYLLPQTAEARVIASAIRAVVRRPNGLEQENVAFRNGTMFLEVHMVTRQVFVNRKPVRLTPREFALVALLATHPERKFSKSEIINRICPDPEDGPSPKNIDVFVCKVRQRFECIHPDARGFVATIHGYGYRLDGRRESCREAFGEVRAPELV